MFIAIFNLIVANEEKETRLKKSEELEKQYQEAIASLKADYDKLKESLPHKNHDDSFANLSTSFIMDESVREFSFSNGQNFSYQRVEIFGENMADILIPELKRLKSSKRNWLKYWRI